MEKKQIIIRARKLYDGKTTSNNKSIIIENNKITEVTEKSYKSDFSGIVTPAFIDAHSHIGMERQGEPHQEGEANDFIDQFLPLLNPINSVYFDDRGLTEAVDFGVLYSCIVPGSGNIFGGRAMVIKNFARHRNEALVKDYGFKMALGYNPRSTTDWKGHRPSTRMGVYRLLEEKFDNILDKEAKALLKKEKALSELKDKTEKDKLNKETEKKHIQWINREYENELSMEERTVLDLLRGNKTAKVHVHKEDDIYYLIDLKNKYGINVTADHTCDVFHQEVYDALADNDIPVVFGPIGALDYKVELKHAYYHNTRLLMRSKAFFGLMTDHPVILTPHLRESLKYFLIQGMSEAEAISLITLKNARILGIDNELGSIENDKLASIIVWNTDPLHLKAFPKTVIAEGKVIRKN